MLEITIPPRQLYEENSNTLLTFKGATIKLEHSLLSISKWESKWKKPFLDDKNEKTVEESIDYVRCMTITQSVDPLAYLCLTRENMEDIKSYMEDTQTATWFSKIEEKKYKNRPMSRKITSELIYYWMSELNLPFDVCEKWHINRLMTLIKIANIENQPPQKMSKKEATKYRQALNESRKAQYHTRG